MKNKLGFTLIEMLVVVLIIGILAGVALPQYQMAVTKAKVASILPIMRRWKDALQEYKLQHGDYSCHDDICPDADTLGVNWPSDWNDGECGDSMECSNDYWYSCFVNEEETGYVYCKHTTTNNAHFGIWMFQPDDEYYEDVRGMIICQAEGEEANKVCKALGGKLLDGIMVDIGQAYKLKF